MAVHLFTPELLSSQAQLREALLARVPLEQQAHFFAPPHPTELTPELHGLNPETLEKAVVLLTQAKEEQWPVLIFGDYDCDGVTATAILWDTLREWGLMTKPFLPHRERHGYGLAVKALEEIWQQSQPKLVITVDNGIVAHEALAWLKERGVMTLVTDHHERDSQEPDATLVLHSPKLAGVTVSWMLAHALAPKIAVKHLDLAVLGTLADQVPLIGANRSFAVHGLAALRATKRPSLLALAQVAGMNLSEASVSTVHYGLVPRINAAGRLGDATDALRTLVSRNPTKTLEMAERMHATNTRRQELTKEWSVEVLAQAESQKDEVLLIASGEFHEGIIGLLASTLTEQYHKPSIVFSLHGDVAKASCRSVPGFHLTEFLRAQTEVPYLALGGHALAAGFSVARSDVPEVTKKLQAAALTYPHTLFAPTESHINAFARLDWPMISRETLATLSEFAPFGAGNEEPSFLLDPVAIVSSRMVGKTQEHQQIVLSSPGGKQRVEAIAFRAAERLHGPINKLTQAVVSLSPSKYARRPVEVVIESMHLPE